ncbi:MAG TPA: alpha/beta fold hydrolase [Steroidobacteraceae bacterium]|nr:alpha/beta fold hydrolase [Steroidobacteraceae bacterium]
MSRFSSDARRRLWALALLAALLLAQAAYRRLHAPLPAAGTAGATAAAATRAPQPGAPERLRMGRLTLRPCLIGGRLADGLASIAAYCASFPVPEDWAAVGGRRIDLHVAVVRAESDTPAPDLVTFLDGGPGGAATEDYPAIAGALEPLRERHDILLVDQRGTGGSNPLDCPQLPQRRPSPAVADEPQVVAQQLRACLAQLSTHAAPQFYTTTDAVRDLEAVRRALGAAPLDVIGVSYGTRVAQQYARRYPAAVRSVVLDSPVPNSVALGNDHAVNLERALRLQFALCRANAACKARFGDPYATLIELRDRLRAHPVGVDLRDPQSFQPLHLTLTADDLATVVRFYAYDPLTAALLPLVLHEAQQGNYAPLLGQRTLLANDLGDQITSGEELSVICAEDVDLLTPRAAADDTLLGNEVITREQAACRVWPHGSRPANFHAAWQSAVPVLVLDGELDPVTPPAYGSEIVQQLSDARQLIAPGQGHSVIGAGCMPRLVQRFVETLDPKGLDAGCLAHLGAVPAFLDYNGAGP